MTPSDAIIFLQRAENVGDFKLRLSFNDGTEQTVDFEPFLRRSRNPLIQAYLTPAMFSGFELREGDLVWGDYELCFPIADLYEGRI